MKYFKDVALSYGMTKDEMSQLGDVAIWKFIIAKQKSMA